MTSKVTYLGDLRTSSEHINSGNKIITDAPLDNHEKGGTMRLGSWKCDIKPNTLAYKVYNKTQINERHRHRYEVNNQYVTLLEDSGLKASSILLCWRIRYETIFQEK